MYKLDITYSWDDAEEGMQFSKGTGNERSRNHFH